MPYTTKLGKTPIIDRDNHPLTFVGEKTVPFGRGLKPRDYKREPFGAAFAAYSGPMIPRGEWRDRIEERDRTKSRQADFCDALGIKIKHQSTTNYCWIFAPTKGVEIARAKQGQRYVSLSPASVGARIKNFRNQGGWGTEGLQYIVDHGLVPSDKWPDIAIDRKYDTDVNDQLRVKYRITEWWDLKPRSFDQLMSAVLVGVPVAIGLNWWGHEVLAIDGVVLGSDDYGILIDNSWGTGWGDKGRGVLTQSKATPDDAVAPRVAIAA